MNADPGNYFRREWIPLDDATMHRFQRYTLDPMITEFQMIDEAASVEISHILDQQQKESLLLKANTDHCMMYNRPCEYLTLCKNDFRDDAVEYTTMVQKHSELTDVNIQG
jgi:hypothetical protein